MSKIEIDKKDTVGDIVARYPGLAHTFEAIGIDYCCGGKQTLERVCREKALAPDTFIIMLAQVISARGEEKAFVDASAMSLTELADHIVDAHHGYLRQELPRLDMLTEKVAVAHGDDDPRLRELRDIFVSFANEMMSHMIKEEQILFPIIRSLETGCRAETVSVTAPIRQMELEHHGAGDALERMRELTDGFRTPEGCCNTYRAMLDALINLELDMHQHVHKEDNVLFPKSAALDSQLAEGGRAEVGRAVQP